MPHLILFSTAGCHLCEQAQARIAACLGQHPIMGATLDIVDIADDPQLLERYGESIPVLRNDDAGIELNWPFAEEDVRWILL